MNIKRAYDPHRDLLELHGLERPACSNTPVPRGSHHISSLWSPVVATGGNQWQIGSERKPKNKPKPLPWVATGCVRRSMVRRGSTVRVRQRALAKKKSPETGIFVACHSATEHLRITVGTAVEVSAPHEKWLQIGLLRGIVEHLLETEEVDGGSAGPRSSIPLEQAQFGNGLVGKRFLGDRYLGTVAARNGCSECHSGNERVARNSTDRWPASQQAC
jgi:hypothetical protein